MDIFWDILSTMTKQQFDAKQVKSSRNMRLLFYGLLMASLVLTTSYSGCLYSLMTIPIVSKPIENINDLALSLSQGEVKVISVGVAAHCQEIMVCSFNSIHNHKYNELGIH